MTNLRLSACPSVLCTLTMFSSYKISPVYGSNSGLENVTIVLPEGLVSVPFSTLPMEMLPVTPVNLTSLLVCAWTKPQKVVEVFDDPWNTNSFKLKDVPATKVTSVVCENTETEVVVFAAVVSLYLYG